MHLQKLFALIAVLSPFALPLTAQAAPWTFDRSAGTLNGDAAWLKTAQYGTQALQLSGHGSLDVSQPVVDTRQSFTVSAWVKVKQLGGYQTFVSTDGTQVSGFFLQLRASGTFGFTRLSTDQTDGPASIASSAVPVQPGVWYNLVGVQDAAAQTLSLYVNGVLQQTVSYKTPWQATGPTEIGRGFYGGQPVDYVNGEIDDVHLTQGVALDLPQLAAIAARTHALDSALNIDLSKPGPRISPLLYGLMIEDISHSIDGGLYAELIQNRALKDNSTVPAHWSLAGGSSAGTLALDTTQPVPNTALTNSLRLDITAAGQDVGAANDGYWGIPVRPNTIYHASFYAKSSVNYYGPLTASLQSADGTQTFASATTPALSAGWRKYTLTLKTGQAGPSADNRFVLMGHGVGTIWLTQVSLMPPTYHNRPNGSRIDLMQKLAAMHPAFLRMPGGNYLEGNTIAERFNWKQTIGDISQRPGHQDPWGYRSDDGYGLLEYLDWCEDLHMQTVLAVFAGYALGGEHVPAGPGLTPYVQDALDEIEYATGGPDTKWGLVRIKDGHPAPFAVPYVEVGNEDFFDKSGSYDGRFAQFYDAIRAKYPHIQIIATTPVKSRRPDVVDDHFYRSAGDFEADTHHYDTYDRSGPKIFVGEYASQEGRPTPNLSGALGDAAFMTGFERNADVVVIASYAPLLVNINPSASQWGTNLIGFNALQSYVSPAYYTQQLFSLYHGDTVVPAALTGGSGLAYAVSKSRTGTVYIKVVNSLASPQTATFTLSGTHAIAPVGTAIVLSSANLSDTNTLADPNKVRPIQSKLTGIGRQFRHVFPPYSLTVLLLKAQ
jgi:alpha-L-arabinofuranosidase